MSRTLQQSLAAQDISTCTTPVPHQVLCFFAVLFCMSNIYVPFGALISTYMAWVCLPPPPLPLQKTDGVEGLLKLIAGTLAYFKVASKRVIDNVPMHLKHYLLQRYCTELDELLVKRAAADSAAATGGCGVSGVRTDDQAAAAAAAAAGGGGGADAAGEGVQQQQQQQQPTAEQLMAEDASTADMRAQLKRQLEQLHHVRRILERF
jgi:hypothetical protein